MSVVQFLCPSCQAPLRLENRALFVGRAFDCPDCGESLLIEAAGSSGVTAKRITTPTRRVSEGPETVAVIPSLARRASLQAASKVADLGVDLQTPKSVWDRLSRRPALLGWIVAALCALILLVVVNSGKSPQRLEGELPVVAESKPSAPSESAEQNSKTAVEPDPGPANANDKPVDAAITDDSKAVEKSAPPQPNLDAEAPRDNKPPAEAVRVEKPAGEEPKPVAVPPAPEPAPVPLTLSSEAVEAKLRQKIARFEHPKPIAFVKLLDTVEELAGVPIVWDLDRVEDEQLQKPVTIRLKATTVGEILDTLLKQVGLERRTVDGRIELRPSAQ